MLRKRERPDLFPPGCCVAATYFIFGLREWLGFPPPLTWSRGIVVLLTLVAVVLLALRAEGVGRAA